MIEPLAMRAHSASPEEISFLHRMDSVAGEAIEVTTTPARLRAASFLDGRERFWTGERLIDLVPGPSARTAARMICHVGFCGSTLLARLIDDPGRVLVLKEPQCLADIASQRQAIAAGSAAAPLPALVDHALSALSRSSAGHETIVIKPTNWVNSLVGELCAPRRATRAVFVSMDRRAYLGAVFRGGRERLEFCTRLAAELAPAVSDGEGLLRAAIAADGDPFDRVARIAALLHLLQERLFAEAIAANGWDDAVRVQFADLVAQPDEVARQVRSILGLGDPVTDAARSSHVMERHTKDPSRQFDPAGREDEDAAVEHHHGARFDAALAWLDGVSA